MPLNSSDARQCATALRGGSRSFHAASRLLPPRVRGPATALYAYCRDADDAIDHAPAARRDAALADLHARLDAIYAGTPAPIPSDRAFARIVQAYDIPRALPAALLEGFAWDAEGRRYDTIDELEHYAARVAGTVGAMMAILMGVRRADTLARAAELGLAMQLTNIARDVGEDARAGRLYLPQFWLLEAGVEPESFLRAPASSVPVRQVVARLLAHAGALYTRSATGIAALPADCRPAIHAARLLYAEIGHGAGAPGFDPVQYRAVVPGRRKAMLLGRAVLQAARDGLAREAPMRWDALPSVSYLVAEAAQYAASPPARLPAWRRAEEKMVWVLDLFAALEARERAGRVA